MAYTGATCAVFILIIFNITTLLAGIGLAGIGIWVLVDSSFVDLLDFIEVAHDDELLKYVAILLIVVGGTALIIGIFGIIAAVNRNKCMLGFYAVILVIIMGAEIAGGVLAIIYKDKILDKLEDETLKKLKEDELIEVETTGDDIDYKFTAFGAALSFVQYEFDCCGIKTYTDYKDWIKRPDNLKDWAVLPTCCNRATNKDVSYEDLRKEPKGADDKNLLEYVEWDDCNQIDNPTEKYPEGCKDKLLDWFEEKAYIFIGCGIGIGCLQILGFILTICLCQYPRSKDYE